MCICADSKDAQNKSFSQPIHPKQNALHNMWGKWVWEVHPYQKRAK